MSEIYIGINNTKTTYTIREYPILSNKIVGKLYPNELCICNTEHNEVISFRNSSGVIDCGIISDQPFAHAGIDQLPYAIENIEGKDYKIYRMRRSMPVYKAGGDRWGTVAAGMYVATDTCTPGQSHSDWMKVTYVKSTSGKWVRVTGDNVQYGFVDTGFSQASAGSKIALQGNW